MNIKWKEWADEKRIEAAMTSQVIMMEYFLNHKFRKYFLNTSEHIVISDGAINGVAIYWEQANKNICELPLYNEEEVEVSDRPTTPLRWKDEKMPTSDVSFVVSCPAINTQIISQEELTAMITYYVDRYPYCRKKIQSYIHLK